MDLADEMGQGKAHDTLIDQKRVTCELHDSFFPLDDDQSCYFKGRVGVELLYNSVKTEVKRVGVPVRVGEGDIRDVVGKATPGRKGLGP